MKKGILIELDKPRNLRYGINALVTVEELMGRPLTHLNLESVSLKDLRAILYAGLYHEDSSLTPEKAADLIDEYSDIETVAQKIGEAISLAFGGNNKKNA